MPDLMHAVVVHEKGPPDVLKYEAVARPAPGAGEVLCQVLATGVNYADVMKRGGDTYPVPIELPYTPGAEAVARIVEAGDGVDTALVGRRVIVFPGASCYADYVVSPANRVYHLPEAISDEQGVALFGQGTTAGIMLKHSTRMAPGETVLVQAAAGGVGLMAVQIAKAWGAGKVIGMASTPEKRDLVLQYGADLAVNPYGDSWVDEIREFTGGRGVDIVLEMTGGAVAQQCFDLLAPFGRSVIYGYTSEVEWLLNTHHLARGGYSVCGFWTRLYLDDHKLFADLLEDFAGLISEGKLKVHSGGRWPLSQAAKAHAAMEDRNRAGKITLVPDELFA